MRNRDLDYITFIPELVSQVPELKPIYDMHLQTYEELVPYVFVYEVTRFMFEKYSEIVTEPDDAEHVQRVLVSILNLMEEAAVSSDFDLRNLIAAGFIEGLPPSDAEEVETYTAIKAMLGPHLRKLLKVMDPS